METLKLPSGEEVTPQDVLMYKWYPYRFRPAGDGETAAFYLTPLYWGGGEMDVPFPDRGVLKGQWGEDSRGVLTTEEWAEWLREVREDDRFAGAELDALAEELGVSTPGLSERIRRALGF
jgi:hypothetical protein